MKSLHLWISEELSKLSVSYSFSKWRFLFNVKYSYGNAFLSGLLGLCFDEKKLVDSLNFLQLLNFKCSYLLSLSQKMDANQNFKSDDAQCRCTSLLSVVFAIAAKQIDCFEIDSNYMVRNEKTILELVV